MIRERCNKYLTRHQQSTIWMVFSIREREASSQRRVRAIRGRWVSKCHFVTARSWAINEHSNITAGRAPRMLYPFAICNQACE